MSDEIESINFGKVSRPLSLMSIFRWGVNPWQIDFGLNFCSNWQTKWKKNEIKVNNYEYNKLLNCK